MLNHRYWVIQGIAISLLSLTGVTPLTAQVKAQDKINLFSDFSPNFPVNSRQLIAQLNQRIKFPTGKSSATVKGGVARGTVNTYTIGAKKGQTMSIEIQSVEGNAVFEIVTPQRKSLVTEQKSWSGKLPSSGDYRIIVGTERGGASYTLSVGIQ